MPCLCFGSAPATKSTSSGGAEKADSKQKQAYSKPATESTAAAAPAAATPAAAEAKAPTPASSEGGWGPAKDELADLPASDKPAEMGNDSSKGLREALGGEGVGMARTQVGRVKAITGTNKEKQERTGNEVRASPDDPLIRVSPRPWGSPRSASGPNATADRGKRSETAAPARLRARIVGHVQLLTHPEPRSLRLKAWRSC